MKNRKKVKKSLQNIDFLKKKSFIINHFLYQSYVLSPNFSKIGPQIKKKVQIWVGPLKTCFGIFPVDESGPQTPPTPKKKLPYRFSR